MDVRRLWMRRLIAERRMIVARHRAVGRRRGFRAPRWNIAAANLLLAVCRLGALFVLLGPWLVLPILRDERD
jgi:hypothetical protein